MVQPLRHPQQLAAQDMPAHLEPPHLVLMWVPDLGNTVVHWNFAMSITSVP